MKDLLQKSARCLAWLGTACCMVANAHAASPPLPDKPVRIIAPAAPGGILDLTSRYVAEQLGKIIDRPVIVENKSGAGGILGIQSMLRSDPDGMTLVMGSLGPNAANYALYKSLPYSKEDLAPVIHVLSMPDVVVINAKIPARNIDELRKYAAGKPGGLSMAVSTAGSSGHLAGELFKSQARIPAVNVVYRGAAPALMDLVGGQVDAMVDNLITALPLIREGKLRALAVTSAERSPELPDIPTMKESGFPDFEVSVWLGLFTSAKAPAPVRSSLNQALQQVLGSETSKHWFAQQGGRPIGGTPEQFARFVDAETTRWGAVIKEAKIHVD